MHSILCIETQVLLKYILKHKCLQCVFKFITFQNQQLDVFTFRNVLMHSEI
jgi:hypothetical protein